MKNKILVFLASLFCVAQTSIAQKINVEKVFGGYKFTQNGQVLKMNQLANKVSGNFECRQLMGLAKHKIGISKVLSGVGGFLIGWSAGVLIRGDEPNLYVPAAGIVLASIGLPLGSSGVRQAKEAVRIYNNSIEQPTGAVFKPEFKVAASQKGLSLIVRF